MRVFVMTVIVFGLIGVASAQSQDKSKSDPPAKADTTKTKSGVSKAKSTLISDDKGIGPIKEIKLGAIDTALVSKGAELFKSKCVTCHLLDKKKLAPPLRDIVKQRTPEFIMNMIINTEEMQKKDAEVKKLIDEYQTYMTILDLNKDQARSLLEFLRESSEHPPGN